MTPPLDLPARLTDHQIEEIQRRLDAVQRATGSESWFVARRENDPDNWWVWAENDGGDFEVAAAVTCTEPADEIIAAFIAEARNTLPALLGEVKQLRQRLDAVKALHSEQEAVATGRGPVYYCCDDGFVWPCRTARALAPGGTA